MLGTLYSIRIKLKPADLGIRITSGTLRLGVEDALMRRRYLWELSLP